MELVLVQPATKENRLESAAVINSLDSSGISAMCYCFCGAITLIFTEVKNNQFESLRHGSVPLLYHPAHRPEVPVCL